MSFPERALLPSRPRSADEQKVSDLPLPSWWPAEQVARPRAHRIVGGNGAPTVDLPVWAPPAARVPQQQNNVATLLGDDGAQPRDLMDQVEADDLPIPVGWLEADPSIQPENGWIEAQNDGNFWSEATIGNVELDQDVLATPAPVRTSAVPGAPVRPETLAAALNLLDATAAEQREVHLGDPDTKQQRRQTLPAMPQAPSLPVVTSEESFDISRALFVEEDTSIDPLDPQVTVIERFPWQKVTRYVTIALIAAGLLFAGVSFLKARSVSKRHSTVRNALTAANEQGFTNAEVRYEHADGTATVGTVDVQREPLVQHTLLTAMDDKGTFEVEALWADRDLFLRSPRGGVANAEGWTAVRLSSDIDLRPSLDVARLIGTETPDPLVPLRLMAAASPNVAEGQAENIGQVPTQRYEITFDVTKAASKAVDNSFESIANQYGWTGVVSATIWLDGDRKLVQYDLPANGGDRVIVTMLPTATAPKATVPSSPVEGNTDPAFLAEVNEARA